MAKILGLGEEMLRLCPAEYKRIRQVLPGAFEASFGGGEANVCASTAILGGDAVYLTALPGNDLSESFFSADAGLGLIGIPLNSRM